MSKFMIAITFGFIGAQTLISGIAGSGLNERPISAVRETIEEEKPFVSEEYLRELEYNSKENVYYGDRD